MCSQPILPGSLTDASLALAASDQAVAAQAKVWVWVWERICRCADVHVRDALLASQTPQSSSVQSLRNQPSAKIRALIAEIRLHLQQPAASRGKIVVVSQWYLI